MAWLRQCVPTRPRLSGEFYLPRGGGGGVRGQKKVCIPKIDLQLRAPLTSFLLRKIFLMWLGGYVGQAEEPRLQSPPPPG